MTVEIKIKRQLIKLLKNIIIKKENESYRIRVKIRGKSDSKNKNKTKLNLKKILK